MSITSPIHILFVDDEPDLEILVRQRFRKVVKEGLWSLHFANNGAKALEELAMEPLIGIVVTDINMPVMDGLTFLNELKKLDRPVRAVVASAYGDMENIRTAMNRGAYDFVTKPVDFNDLETTLQKTIADQQRLREGEEAKESLSQAMREKEAAEESARFKQQFLANMSHEIRTPLNAILGMTHLLLDKEPREDQLRYLRAMRQASGNLLGIINDILDVSKIEAGKIVLEHIDFDLRETVDGVYQTLHLKAEENQIRFIQTVADAVPAWIKGDPTRVTQVLTNLAGNAIKFTPQGGQIDVTVTVEKGTGQDWLRFDVKDTGIGIAPEQLGKIFDSFSQESSDTTRKFGGTGLGLTISRELVELMGGTLQVSSTKGVGTTFWFLLPCTPGEARQREERKTGSTILSRELIVLLAEDQPMNQMVACDTLEGLFPGIRVDVANNGQEAVDQAGNQQYDLIFMDVHMPVKDGYTATQEIRASDGPNARTPILALTANAVKEEIDKCIAAGMDRHLAKPFDPEKLKSTVIEMTSI